MARAVGYAAVPILIAPTIGPVVAGALLKYAGWPWLFYINIPVGILAVTLAAFLLPSDAGAIQKRPFDLLGFLTISPGLACLLYGVEQASGRKGTWILVLGVILLSAFVWHANRIKAKALILNFFATKFLRLRRSPNFFPTEYCMRDSSSSLST
jgi:MFS family permease